ncbi:MAG: polyprenyl synthetase family protein [Deltaproteobacteria bacterium]|nr:polyprenyl synthetase family protein [Deltaproteobacteria bacterium]MBT7203049.1 polyprenyl synthetase family protein [Deltaproteobacteria bacterium]
MSGSKLTESGNLKEFLRRASAEIERATLEVLPSKEPYQELYSIQKDYPLRGGKRFRPALLLLCAEWFGASYEDALPSAVALELFHNFALIHDDIEDSSLFRRGKPTLHHLHGIPLAINAGDSLFGMVYEILMSNRERFGDQKALDIISLFNQIFRATFEGQAYDIGWVANNHFPTRAEYFEMIRRKTGVYSGKGPCQLGALIADVPPDILEKIGDFGEALGIGFQIKDDVLNLEEDAGELKEYGKERGGDIREGKRTLITIHMLENLNQTDSEKLRAILLKPAEKTLDDDVDWVIEKAIEKKSLNIAWLECKRLAEIIEEKLENLVNSPAKNIASEIANFLVLERSS